MSIFSKIIGDPNEKFLKKLQPVEEPLESAITSSHELESLLVAK